MGQVKRFPKIRKEHNMRYSRISKADLVEAFRDIYREMCENEFDDTEWMDDLERRVKLLKVYREAWAKEDKA